MQILLLLIPLSVVLVGTAIYWFVWAVDNDQMDDLDRYAVEALEDTDDISSNEKLETEQPGVGT